MLLIPALLAAPLAPVPSPLASPALASPALAALAPAPLPAAPQGGSGSTPARFTLPNTFGPAGTGSLEVQLGIYDRDDSPGDGNPFLDEELTVIEPIVVFDYNVSDTFAYSGMLVYDNVSSASIERLSRFPQQSGASGDFYVGANFGLRWKTSEQTSIAARLGASVEYDYLSIHLGGDYIWERRDKDAKLTFSADAFFDTVEPIRFDGSEDDDASRTSLAATVSWYQILNKKTHGTFGATLSNQVGFLETAFNSVIFDDGSTTPNFDLDNNAIGAEAAEALPNDRFRAVLFGRVRRLLAPGCAFELGGRFYDDNWGITGFDVTPRYIQSFDKGRHVVELRYRYYNQTASDFYQRERFDTLPDRRTQDSSFSDFNSNTFGSTWTWNRSPGTRWTFSVDYSMRSDNLDNIYGLVGYRWNF